MCLGEWRHWGRVLLRMLASDQCCCLVVVKGLFVLLHYNKNLLTLTVLVDSLTLCICMFHDSDPQEPHPLASSGIYSCLF